MWLCSIATRLSIKSVSYQKVRPRQIHRFYPQYGPIETEYRVQHLEDARALWERMKNEDDPAVSMTHDGYLKLFQLKYDPDLNHTLRQWGPFDVLLIDEAQVRGMCCCCVGGGAGDKVTIIQYKYYFVVYLQL